MDNNVEIKGVARIVAQYCANYAPPSDLGHENYIVCSTEEIISNLSDMADLTPNVVANTMFTLGFSAVFLRDGRHGWAMKPIPSNN